MPHRRPIASFSLILAATTCLAASACLEDDGKKGTEDRSGILDVGPPSGGNGSTESGGPGAAVGPSAVSVGPGATSTSASGTGGAGGGGGSSGTGTGNGGGGASGTGTASGSGGGGGTQGEVASCALFPTNFADVPACASAPNLTAITSDFTGTTGPMTAFACDPTTVTTNGTQLSVATDPTCDDAIARSIPGQLAGCQIQVTVPSQSLTDARFGVKDLEDPDADEFNFGTVQLNLTPLGGTVTLTATHFGAEGETVLGTRPGETLPLRLFIANAAPDLTCAGIVRNGDYICVGCWTSDPDTDEVLQNGSITLETLAGPALFDDLNL